MDPEGMTLAEAAAFLRLSPEGLAVLNALRRDTLAATQRYSERE